MPSHGRWRSGLAHIQAAALVVCSIEALAFATADKPVPAGMKSASDVPDNLVSIAHKSPL
jgi:hypothetical protein